MSIQSYREIEAAYFDRLRAAVRDAADYFKDENAPPELLTELRNAANVIRNEATVFPGRTHACLEMADWLETSASQIEGSNAAA